MTSSSSRPDATLSALFSAVSRTVLRRNLLIFTLALILCLGAILVFEQVSGSDLSVVPICYLAGLCAVVLPIAYYLTFRALRSLGDKWSHEELPALANRVFRLPRVLAGIHLASWFVIGTIAALLFLVLDRFRPDRSFMMFLACMLAGLGASMVALVRAPVLLSPLTVALSGYLREDGKGTAVVRTSLKQKITLVLGGVVFFSSAFGLYSSFSLQREIVAYYVEQQGNDIAGSVRSAVGTYAGSRRELCSELERLTPAGGMLAYSGTGFSCRSGVELAEDRTEMLLNARKGALSVPSENLEGINYSLGSSSLVVLFPRPEWARRVLLASLIFYTLLFLFSAFLAAQVARGLTSPIVELRKQVKSIERGDLSLPICSTSSDEIGDLAQSMEAMRQGLKEMVETIRSLNLTLEEKVRLRTEELELANCELVDTLDRLKEAQVQLVHAEKMASLGRLMTGLAHELNNPVNAILNSASPLARGLAVLPDGENGQQVARLQRAARVVENAAGRMVDLIASMSTFSRQDENVRKPTDLNSAVEATLMLLQHRVEEAGTSVRTDLGPLPQVICNPGEVNQVLMNLLVNALEAVESKGTEGRVVIGSHVSGEEVVITVEDNGPGMEEGEAARIFEPFHTTKDTGTGLGLAISHQVVDRHGGSILVEASPGNGCTFAVRLPLS